MRDQLIRAVIGASLLLSISAGSQAASAQVPDLPAQAADYKPGDLVVDHGVRIVVPFRGQGVYAEALLPDGSHQELQVITRGNGQIEITRQGDESVQGSEGTAGGTSGTSEATAEAAACNDNAYNLESYIESDQHQWYFRQDSTASGFTVSAMESAIRDGIQNIIFVNNNCGLSDNVSASASYQGNTSRTTNIDANSTCQTGDGISMVSFGDLAANDVAYACQYFTLGSPGELTESDVKLNKADHNWTLNPGSGCSNRFDVTSVMTHERGHTYGLGHVGEASHPYLTMSTNIDPCQKSERTLGLGDVRGLEARY